MNQLNREINYGKHKGKKISDIANTDPSYISWMRNQGLCSSQEIQDRDEGNYPIKKYSSHGYWTIFTWNK